MAFPSRALECVVSLCSIPHNRGRYVDTIIKYEGPCPSTVIVENASSHDVVGGMSDASLCWALA